MIRPQPRDSSLMYLTVIRYVKKFLRRDINRIRGIRIRAITADIRKVRIIKMKFTAITVV